MQLRDALDDFKRHRDAPARFPGEQRTTAGLFAGAGGRLVHVGPDGALRDHSYALSRRGGIARSRFGLLHDGDVTWFDGTDQRYDGDTALVVTDHRAGDARVTQYDCTLGDAHVTRFETDADADLLAFVGFAPDGQDGRLGQLHHPDSVEVYHAAEHDFLAATTGFTARDGVSLPDFDELLADAPTDTPRAGSTGRYEEGLLSGDVLARVPFEDGATTLVTLLTDDRETDRAAARDRLAALRERFGGPGALAALRDAAAADIAVPSDAPARSSVVADLRVLSLLSSPRGLRVAGPEFDPYCVHSGGYGYTWFRDDAEIATFLLDAGDALDLPLDDWHARSARAYCETQRADGTWPHRVWAGDATLAPGWANDRPGDGPDYQADQTASVVAYLARYLPRADDALRERVTAVVVDGLDGLDASLAADGRPEVCQNAWENMTGRFAHTAATFLEAYSAAAAAPLPDDARQHARGRADEVYGALDDLWTDRGAYALREHDGALDDRLDSATLALAAAHRAYDRVGTVDADRRDRLASHLDATLDGLWRDPGPVRGLVRFEGDDWRAPAQADPKVWTVSTGWGAHAAGSLAALFAATGDERAGRFAERARDLLTLLSPDGPLCTHGDYLPEQRFDDGTPDSATPLGWPHALRLATVALCETELAVPPTTAD